MQRVLEPREPSAEVTAFAAFVLPRQVEGELHGFAETGEVRVALEEGVQVGLGVVELPAQRIEAGPAEQRDGFRVGAGFVLEELVPEREGGAVFAHDRKVLGLVDGLQDRVGPARRADVGSGAGLEAPGAIGVDEFGWSREAQQAAGCEKSFSDEVHASGEGLRPR